MMELPAGGLTLRAEGSASSRWLVPAAHDQGRSVDLVRLVVALVLLSHPLHALLHPADVAAVAGALGARGLPAAAGLAWAGMVVQLVCAAALFVPRWVIPGALGSIAVQAGGIAFLYAPRWYVVGGLAEDGHPGMEFSALLVACLGGVLYTHWPRRGGQGGREQAAAGGLEIIRVASALALLAHGFGPFVLRDVEGMRAWGEEMTQKGYPFGVALVWSIKSVELTGSLARLARRLVVPACLGHLAYLVPALWIEHRLRWFNVGPGENGIEYPLLLVVCTIACLLAFLPRGRRVALADLANR